MALTNMGKGPGSKLGTFRRRSTYFGAEKNYRGKAPSSGGVAATPLVANALGITPGMPVHQGAVGKLINHPDMDVAAEAKRLMKKF